MAALTIAQNKLSAFVCPANTAVHIKLVRSEDDLSDDSKTFHPQFSHQLFGDNESIFGYKDLQIQLFYSAARLTTYLSMSYSEAINPQNFGGIEADNVLKCIDEKLQPGYIMNLSDFITSLAKDSSFRPFGELIHAFTNNSGGTSPTHNEIYHADIQVTELREYHKKLQTFLLWYIDAASFIDLDDEKWHFFYIYEKFEKDSELRYAILGFATVYHYYAYPKNIRPRLSQMLMFPPFQGKGLGTEFLQAICKYYMQDADVLDITVEDPSDDFTQLRDFVDCENCMKLTSFSPENLKNGFTNEMAQEAQSKLKINKRQARRVYEIVRLYHINTTHKEEYKAYRLDVKKRLNIPYQKQIAELKKLAQNLRPEEVRAMMQFSSKEQRMEQLERQYQELHSSYRSTVERLMASK